MSGFGVKWTTAVFVFVSFRCDSGWVQSLEATRIRELQFELNWVHVCWAPMTSLCSDDVLETSDLARFLAPCINCNCWTLLQDWYIGWAVPATQSPALWSLLTWRQSQWPLSGRFNNKCQSLRRNVSLHITSVANASIVFDWKSRGMGTLWRPVSSG
jgi:hypothetical protein